MSDLEELERGNEEYMDTKTAIASSNVIKLSVYSTKLNIFEKLSKAERVFFVTPKNILII